jgi:predicted transposase YbfD/YdcC
VVTGDALYAQHEVCQRILNGGGDYLVVVKKNQPQLYEDIALLFDQPPFGEVFARAEQKGRSRDRYEVRRLWASGALRQYLDWPCCEQVCKLEREIWRKGKKITQSEYLITSLAAEEGDAERLLSLRREHWGIENRLHYVRDVTMGEDLSQIRTGGAPQVMAALRNTTLGLLRSAGDQNIAAAMREIAWKPEAALRLLGLPMG